VDRTVQLLVPKAREKNLTLLSYVNPNIPAMVRGDSGRVGQILVNLISNALKFTTIGKVVVNSSLVRTEDDTIEVKFTVQDSGVGIDSASIQKLFQPFTQADTSTSRKFGGTGLGLSICKQLVDLMGGQIGVESEPGEGSLFWFTVPFDIPFELAPRQKKTFPLQTDILVFDDDPDSSKIVVDYINSWKIPVTHLKDMSSLKEFAANPEHISQYHLLLMSAGGETTEIENIVRTVQQGPNPPKILIITDHDEAKYLARFENLGVEAFLFRPLQQSSLYKQLIQLLTERDDPDGRESDLDENQKNQQDQTLKKGRILLAEDNSTNQLIAQSFLKELGHSVQTVANGKEALEAMKQSEFDLILMDCQMPEMDGYEATEAIRANISTRIPIIALTANAMKGDEEKCRQAGMNGYLSKPFHKEQLQELLQKYLPKIHQSFDPGRLEMFRDFKDDNDQDLRKTLIASYLQTTPTSVADMEKI
jgi:CheY-like chemotaxis protein